MSSKRRPSKALKSDPSQPKKPAADQLRVKIEAAQAKAYAGLGLEETLHLYLSPAAMSYATPRLIERILQKHYPGQTANTKRIVRRSLESRLIMQEKTSPIRFQNESYHRHLIHYWNLIEQNAEQMTLAEADRPLVATLPTVSLNAGAWKLRGHHGYAIVFNEALLTFLFLLSKIVARYFPGEFLPSKSARHRGLMSVNFDRGIINKILTTDYSGLQDLVNLLTGHIYKGNPLADTKPYLLDQQPNFVAAQLVSNSELFVFAHELAHIVNGDLVESPVFRANGLGDDFDQLTPAPQRELNADAKALHCLIQVWQKTMPLYFSTAYWGAELFLSAAELSQRALTFMIFGEERQIASDTHPPIALRRSSLRDVLRHHVTWQSPLMPQYSEADLAINHADTLVDLVDALWKQAKPLLAVARATGHPLSPRWNAIAAG